MSKKLSSKNIVVIACAGSGKTTHIVEEALKLKDKQILISTYTNENIDQIKDFFIINNGCIPETITIQSWFSFLLREGVRPYQNYMTDKKRVKSVFFQTKSSPYHRKNYYLSPSNYIYSNKVSEFAFECDKKSNGKIINRLEKIYSTIFIDELQDFAGYDLSFLERLFKSKINIVMVGDPRQATFTTNTSQKNKQHRKINIYSWLKEKKSKNEISIKEINESYRCNQRICDFADSLFPNFPKTKSKNYISTKHDGVFCIPPNEVKEYISKHNPTVLRYNKNVNTHGFPAINIGLSKGRTFDRVLIFPTKPMIEYINLGNQIKAGDKSKFYVAVTRSKYSVAFVLNKIGQTIPMFPAKKIHP